MKREELNKIINSHSFVFDYKGDEVTVAIRSFEDPIKSNDAVGDLYTKIDITYKGRLAEHCLSNKLDDYGMSITEEDVKKSIDKLLPIPPKKNEIN